MTAMASITESDGYLESDSIPVFDAIISINEQLAQLPQAERFNDEQIDVIYGIAYALFRQGKIEEANGLFEALIIYRPLDARLNLGFGICCKKMLRFDAAISAFTAAFFCDPNDLTPAIHLAECLAIMEKYSECQKVLNPLISVIEIDDRFLSIQKRAQTLKHMLCKFQFFEEHEGKHDSLA